MPIVIGLWPALVSAAVVINPGDQIVDIGFRGHVDPDFEFFSDIPHGVLAPWADSSIPVEGRVRYLVSPSLDYLFEADVSGPTNFQTNYYLNQGTGHSFRIELRIGSLEFEYDLATAPQYSAGIIILTQDASGQAVELFNDAIDTIPPLPDPVYYLITLQLTDESAPFGLFPPEQLSSVLPPGYYPELGAARGSLYISDFNGTTGESGLGFVVTDMFLVPEPSVPTLALAGLVVLARRRRR